MPDDRNRPAAYELHSTLDGVEVRRVEVIGTFADRAEAREWMIATTPARHARDRAEADRDTLAAGLRALANMIAGYFAEAHSDGHGGANEPDESDPVCHVWNACEAVNEKPDEISTWLYAEHGPGEDDTDEIDLIAAGKVLAAVPVEVRDAV